MKVQLNNIVTETQIAPWMKKLTWALPLFFLAKGLVWLVLPVVLAFYGLN